MHFENLVSSSIGFIHLIFSVLALIFGSIVLLKRKGTKPHKKWGYAYCVSMIGVMLTAFFMYRLFGKFGIFHWMAVLGTITLLAGMIPMFFKRSTRNLELHLGFMYWSVMGLYAAFIAETFVRIPDVVVESGVPNQVFYTATGIGVGIVMFFAVLFFLKKKTNWEKLVSNF